MDRRILILYQKNCRFISSYLHVAQIYRSNYSIVVVSSVAAVIAMLLLKVSDFFKGPYQLLTISIDLLFIS
jgi:hypothetical protein